MGISTVHRSSSYNIEDVEENAFFVFSYGGIYYARGGMGEPIDHDNVLLTLLNRIKDRLASTGGTIFLKELELPGGFANSDNILIVEDYQGRRRVHSNKGSNINGPLLASDPNTAGWGSAQKGYMWFNTTEGKYKYWNGAAVVAYPSEGGAGAPIDASYVTINSEPGLSGEVRHQDIVDDNQKHTPKAHSHPIGEITGHDKAVHDALGINAATLQGSTKLQVQDHAPQAHDHVEVDITDLDHNAQKIKNKPVDVTDIGDNKVLVYKTTGDKFVFEPKAGGGGIIEGSCTILAGNTSVVVNHGKGAIPYPAWSPLDDLGGRDSWVTDRTVSQFTLHISSADFADHNFVYRC